MILNSFSHCIIESKDQNLCAYISTKYYLAPKMVKSYKNYLKIMTLIFPLTAEYEEYIDDGKWSWSWWQIAISRKPQN